MADGQFIAMTKTRVNALISNQFQKEFQMGIKIIDVKVAIDIENHECWAGIKKSLPVTCEEENAALRIFIDGMKIKDWKGMQFSWNDVNKIEKGVSNGD